MPKPTKPQTRRRKPATAAEKARAELAGLEVEAREMKRYAANQAVPTKAADALAYRVKFGEIQKARDKLRRAELRAARRRDPSLGQGRLL